MRFYPIACILLLGSSVSRSLAEPSLDSIRSTLSVYESAIIDLISSIKLLGSLSNSTEYNLPTDKIDDLNWSRFEHSCNIGPRPFQNYASVIKYNRTKQEALFWGDNTGHYPEDVSLSQYIDNEFSKPRLPLSALITLQSLKQTVAERCLVGQNVAIAKLDSSESSSGTLCVSIKNKAKESLRQALTNVTQEEAVRDSVRSSVNGSNSEIDVSPESVVGLFNM